MSDFAIETFDLTKMFMVKKKGKNFLGKLLSKEEGTVVAVDHINLQIKSGELFGLLGPNGAGKTTMHACIRMLSTVLLPNEGTAKVDGFDIVNEPERVRENIGVLMMGERSLYWKLTARENLEYFAAMYHMPPKIAKERIDYFLKWMNLYERADDYVEHYSSGMKQRLALVRCLLHDPPILMLDEPTLGLDPHAARDLRSLITSLKEEGKTIILTTHYMEEADQLCDRVAIIHQGKIIALDSPSALKKNLTNEEALEIEVSNYNDRILECLKQIEGIISVACISLDESSSIGTIRIHIEDSRKSLQSIIKTCNKLDGKINHIDVSTPTLEDVFISLTGEALRA